MTKTKKPKKTKKLTAEQKAYNKLSKAERRRCFQWILVYGKQVRIKRPQLIDGLPVDEFFAQNAEPSTCIKTSKNGTSTFEFSGVPCCSLFNKLLHADSIQLSVNKAL